MDQISPQIQNKVLSSGGGPACKSSVTVGAGGSNHNNLYCVILHGLFTEENISQLILCSHF